MIESRDSNGIRELRLAHGRANALDLELVMALEEAIEMAAADRVRAIVLTGTGHIFCAGVDLFRLLKGGGAYARAFLPKFNQLTRTLYAAEVPIVAALNGHAIAGGAVIAAASDYRLMSAGEGRFGYTELLVGVPFPPSSLEIVRSATPSGLDQMLYTGVTYLPAEALARRLIDEVAEPAQLMDRAYEVAKRIAQVPMPAFAETKRRLRAATLARMIEGERATGAEVVETWAAEATHECIRAYLDRTIGKR
jgi:enoyl-CoA hydratase